MSGPPYPRHTGDSAPIGSFIIGVSPIGPGSDFFWDTIISQYANSPALCAIIQSFFEAESQTGNLNNFFDLIWNVNTAQGYGLDVWGRIVGVSRIVELAPSKFLGFEEAGALTVDPFNQSPFYSGTQVSDSFSLTDPAFRVLIFAKALSNICDGSIPGINAVLLALFPGRGNCYVTDGEDMTMTYTFKFTLTPVEVAVITQTGILPKPAGVSATVVIAP